MRRQRHDNDVGSARILLQAPRERETVHAGKLDIHQDQIGQAIAKMLQRLLRGAGDVDLETFPSKHRCGEELVDLVVLDDQHEWRSRHASAASAAGSTTWRRRLTRSEAPVEPR